MNKIKEKRLEKGLSRAELARVSGVSLRTIENWELGMRKPTNFLRLSALAKALECTIEDLIDISTDAESGERENNRGGFGGGYNGESGGEHR